jgi:hypothetical protein
MPVILQLLGRIDLDGGTILECLGITSSTKPGWCNARQTDGASGDGRLLAGSDSLT